MRPEIKLRAQWLTEWAGQVTRIEPTVGSTPGTPDTFLINDIIAGWVEFKTVGAGGEFEIRKEQLRWHRDFSRYSPFSTFCILSVQGWWLVPSIIALETPFVFGHPVPWEHTTGLMIASALKHYAFKQCVFNADILDEMIEPKRLGKNDGKQEPQGNSSRKRAISAK